MSPPILEEHLLGLPPQAKIVVGAAMAIAGALACDWLWERGWIAGVAVLALVMGALLTWSGREELARERAIEGEVARARAEWAELQARVAGVRSDGRSVVRYLQDRGYREYCVRRWIAEQLGGDPSSSADSSPGDGSV